MPYAQHVICTAYSEAITKPGWPIGFLFCSLRNSRTVLPFTTARTNFWIPEDGNSSQYRNAGNHAPHCRGSHSRKS